MRSTNHWGATVYGNCVEYRLQFLCRSVLIFGHSFNVSSRVVSLYPCSFISRSNLLSLSSPNFFALFCILFRNFDFSFRSSSCALIILISFKSFSILISLHIYIYSHPTVVIVSCFLLSSLRILPFFASICAYHNSVLAQSIQ